MRPAAVFLSLLAMSLARIAPTYGGGIQADAMVGQHAGYLASGAGGERPVPEPATAPSPPDIPGPDAPRPITPPARQAPKKSQKAVVPLVIEGDPAGQVLIVLEAGPPERVLCQARPLLLALEEVVRPEVIEGLGSLVEPTGFIPINAVTRCAPPPTPFCGLELVFDVQQAQMLVRVPSELRKRQQIDANRQGLPVEAASALRPGALSAYLNVRGGLGTSWSADLGEAARGGDGAVDVDGAINFYGWVIEGSGTGSAKPAFDWSQKSLRLVRDFPGQALRFSLGDMATPVTGLLGGVSMTGLGIARNYSLQPYRQIQPLSQFEFFLEQDSRVDVYANGGLMRSLELRAGPHDLRTLPLNVGVSDVQLEVTDILGRRKRLDFNTAMAIEQLAPGIDQFAFSLGIPSPTLLDITGQQLANPALALQYQRGLFSALTAGGFLCGDLQRQSAGGSAIVSTLGGNLSLEAAASHTLEDGAGGALKLGYQYARTRRRGIPWNLALSAHINSTQFHRVGTASRDDQFFYSVSGTQSLVLPAELRASTTWHYGQGRNGQPSEFSVNVGLSKSFSNGVGVYLNGNITRDSIGKNDRSTWISLWWVVPHRRITSLAASTGATPSGWAGSELSWNESSLRPTGGLATSVTVTDDPEAAAVSARITYTGYHGFLEGSYEATRAWEDDIRVAQAARISGGAALVFADGRFGLSRPVTDSFALIAPVKAIRGKTIGINAGPHGYEARADLLGPGTLPTLIPYRVATIRLDPSLLPPGYSLGAELYSVMPAYKSGVLVSIGRDATVYLRGVLLYRDNSPVALRAAEVLSLTDKRWKSLPFFSNRAGRFALDGLKPGRYQLRMSGEPYERIEFEIPPKTEGVFDLGTLTLMSFEPH